MHNIFLNFLYSILIKMFCFIIIKQRYNILKAKSFVLQYKLVIRLHVNVGLFFGLIN